MQLQDVTTIIAISGVKNTKCFKKLEYDIASDARRHLLAKPRPVAHWPATSAQKRVHHQARA